MPLLATPNPFSCSAKTVFTGASPLDYLRAGVTAVCLELIFVSAEYAMPQDVPLSDGLG